MKSNKFRKFDAVVLGAGFYGLYIASFLRGKGKKRVLIVEAEEAAMLRGSFGNQARVHSGYHYPRSILTGFRSQVSSQSFAKEFEPAIDRNFQHIYAIAKTLSKTNAKQFEYFCNTIGASLETSPAQINKQLSNRLIEKAWIADEPAFNALTLREIMIERLQLIGGVEIRYATTVERICEAKKGVEVIFSDGTSEVSPLVISCLYASVNQLHSNSGLPLLPLQHELAELALVKFPDFWANRALTIMDGPFFSFMPFPSKKLHTLSHVRYTPQIRWDDSNGVDFQQMVLDKNQYRSSTFKEMKADLCRYVSGMGEIEYVDSLFEIKTVLSQNDLTDSRPIIVRNDFGISGYCCVLGGKIDNVTEIIEELDKTLDFGD